MAIGALLAALGETAGTTAATAAGSTGIGLGQGIANIAGGGDVAKATGDVGQGFLDKAKKGGLKSGPQANINPNISTAGIEQNVGDIFANRIDALQGFRQVPQQVF